MTARSQASIAFCVWIRGFGGSSCPSCFANHELRGDPSPPQSTRAEIRGPSKSSTNPWQTGWMWAFHVVSRRWPMHPVVQVSATPVRTSRGKIESVRVGRWLPDAKPASGNAQSSGSCTLSGLRATGYRFHATPDCERDQHLAESQVGDRGSACCRGGFARTGLVWRLAFDKSRNDSSSRKRSHRRRGGPARIHRLGQG